MLTFALDTRLKRADLSAAAFVHDVRSGDALQAITLCHVPRLAGAEAFFVRLRYQVSF